MEKLQIGQTCDYCDPFSDNNCELKVHLDTAHDGVIHQYSQCEVTSIGEDTALTLFLPGGGDFTPPSTFRQFSPDVLIRGGSNYSLNSSFVITEHIKLVPGQKIFPTAHDRPPKSFG